MSFTDDLKKTLDETFNVSETENGAIGYRTTGKDLLDLHFAVSSLRNVPDEEVERRFARVFFSDKLLAVKWLFFAGDVRGGLGERRLFRIAMKYLAKHESEIAEKLVPLVPEYTRWDNLLPLLDTELKDAVVLLLKAQLSSDEEKAKKGESISLCAKWMPSPNASSKKTKALAKILIKAFGVTEKQYRQTLARLREHLDVVEVKTSRKDWGAIHYESVPSKANLLYSGAFLRNDAKRRTKYLNALEKGETKINASVLFPHDIVHRYMTENQWDPAVKKRDPALEEMWKGLPDYVQSAEDTICVADGSGSMTMTIGKTGVTCLDVANALAIYFAERSEGQFKNKYITFSENPQLVDLSKAKSLRDKIGIAITHDEVANTNIEAVFDLILKTAIQGKYKQSELPRNILILSDMEFDGCVETSRYKGPRGGDDFQKLFAVFAEKYAAHGYKLPRLAFWNICGRTETIPVKENDAGVTLVSGFSPVVVNMVLSRRTDPFECLLEQLAADRYAPVENAVKDVLD